MRKFLPVAILLTIVGASVALAGALNGPFLTPGATYFTPDSPAFFNAAGSIVSGPSGVTAAGTSCTITAISKGIITAATCS